WRPSATTASAEPSRCSSRTEEKEQSGTGAGGDSGGRRLLVDAPLAPGRARVPRRTPYGWRRGADRILHRRQPRRAMTASRDTQEGIGQPSCCRWVSSPVVLPIGFDLILCP